MPVAAPTNTLQAIQTKVRRLTRSPSTSQITDADLQNYINTFVVYDFPEHLRMFNLRTTFNFVANSYQDEYPTDIASFAGVTTNPLYDFQNRYLTVHPPFYIAGYQAFSTQSREQFYAIYPFVNNIQQLFPTGDGVTTTFTGFIPQQNGFSSPPQNSGQTVLLKRNVLFSSVDSNGNGLSLADVPLIDPSTGNESVLGNLYVPGMQPTVAITTASLDPNNNINYLTGQYTITFPVAPGPNVTINSQTVPMQVSLPQAVLYYNNTFFLRPIPDQPYTVNFEAYVAPSYLMETTSTPALDEWWQYIAYGAAKKIFEDRLDMDSVQMIMPEFMKQQNLCQRRSIVQYTNERTATIYTEQTNFGPGGGQWGWGGGPF